MVFRAETVLNVLISRTETVRNVLISRTETVRNVLIFRTEAVLTVSISRTEIRYFLWTSKNDGNRDQQTMFITIASVLFFESMYMATQVAKITKVSVKKVKAKHALTLKRAQSNPDVDGGDGRDDEHQSVAKISPSTSESEGAAGAC